MIIKQTIQTKRIALAILKSIAAALVAGSLTVGVAASGGSNSGGVKDVVGGVSTGGGGGGGGGGGKTGVASPAPAPVVVVPFVFATAVEVNGVVPQCSGSYSVDPYYPTLSLENLHLQVSSMDVADGSQLNVVVDGVYYGSISIFAQSGTINVSTYVAPGTVIHSVVISNPDGTVIAVGN